MIFHDTGPIVWGQKTLQLQATALNRVNVRRSLIYAENAIAALAKQFLFSPNVATTWSAFARAVGKFLNGLKGRAFEDTLVVCDATTNTPDTIANNQMVANVFLHPVHTVEQIALSYVIAPEGVDFKELLQAV